MSHEKTSRGAEKPRGPWVFIWAMAAEPRVARPEPPFGDERDRAGVALVALDPCLSFCVSCLTLHAFSSSKTALHGTVSLGRLRLTRCSLSTLHISAH